MAHDNGNSTSASDDKPLPLSEDPKSPVTSDASPAVPAVVRAYLRGTTMLEKGALFIRGRWAFSKSDYDENDPAKVSPFELRYVGDASQIPEGSVMVPPSGEYKGTISIKQEGRAHLKISEPELFMNFSTDVVSGKGYNKYGRFELEGAILGDSQVEFYKSYTGEPAPEKPKKVPKELKKLETASAKRPRAATTTVPPSTTPIADLTPAPVSESPVVEEPCMRGEMETSAEGTVVIKGRWALRAADFDLSPKSSSPFDYTFNGTVSVVDSAPPSGHFTGGFQMKMGAKQKRVKESDILFQFSESSSDPKVFELRASGSNEFGVFKMRGTATKSTVSTSPNAYTVEIFRTYTSYHPPPVVPKTGRGWAIEGPVISTPSIARLSSAPASKEPRSGLASSSSKKKSIPTPSPITASISDSGRKRKAPNKLVDELNSRDNISFDHATRSKLESLLRHLKSKESSAYFLEPVDPVRLGIPSYFDIIKQPMDLKTVETKLLGNEYSDVHEIGEDIRLIFSNSWRFNDIDKTAPVYVATNKLSTIFENKWREFEAWCEKKAEQDREKEMKATTKTPSAKPKSEAGSSRKRAPAVAVVDEQYREMQTQMFEMTQQMLNLQRTVTTQNIQLQIAAASGGNKRKQINVADVLQPDDPASELLLETIPLTQQEKEKLTKQVEKLPASKLNRVIEIVQEHMQLSGLHDKDAEIELDVDTLPIKTLRALQRYLKECFPPKKIPTKVKLGAKAPAKKKVAPLPVPCAQTSYEDQPAKRSRVESNPTPADSGSSKLAVSNGHDTSDSDGESSKPAPWESKVLDTSTSRRMAGLDSDSEDDEGMPPPVTPAPLPVPTAVTSSSSATSADSGASLGVQLVAAAPTEDVKVNVDAWGSGWAEETSQPEMARERSDSYDDTANNWSHLRSDIQEKHQVDEHRKMEQVRLIQQQQQQHEDAAALARRLQEQQKEQAKALAKAGAEAEARRLEEARLNARQAREGVGTMDLDANKTRADFDNFIDEFC